MASGGRTLYKKEQRAKKEAKGDEAKAAFEKACKAYAKSGDAADKAEVYRQARLARKHGVKLDLPGGL